MNIEDYLNKGILNGVQLGFSKEQVLSLWGKPQSWRDDRLGKDDIMQVEFLNSNLWFFKNDAVVVFFSETGVVAGIHLNPHKINAADEMFNGWQINDKTTMADFKSLLIRGNQVYTESDSSVFDYWILTEKHCLAYCFALEDGVEIPKEKRKLRALRRYASAKYLPF